MSLIHLLFSFHGRIGRLPFWVASTVLLVLLLGLAALILGSAVTNIDFRSPAAGQLVVQAMIDATWMILPFLLVHSWMMLALAAKRLHDRNYSAWLLLPYAVVSLVPYIQIVAWICYFIEIGCRAGTPGSNRFDVEAGPRDVADNSTASASWADNLDVEKLARQAATEEYQPRVLRKRKPAVERGSGQTGFGRRTRPA